MRNAVTARQVFVRRIIILWSMMRGTEKEGRKHQINKMMMIGKYRHAYRRTSPCGMVGTWPEPASRMNMDSSALNSASNDRLGLLDRRKHTVR
jgi:hypothetical protein